MTSDAIFAWFLGLCAFTVLTFASTAVMLFMLNDSEFPRSVRVIFGLLTAVASTTFLLLAGICAAALIVGLMGLIP